MIEMLHLLISLVLFMVEIFITTFTSDRMLGKSTVSEHITTKVDVNKPFNMIEWFYSKFYVSLVSLTCLLPRVRI